MTERAKHDPRVMPHNGKFEEVLDSVRESLDLVIFSFPLSLYPKEEARKLICQMMESLNEGGLIVAVQMRRNAEELLDSTTGLKRSTPVIRVPVFGESGIGPKHLERISIHRKTMTPHPS